jgi:sulfonate transport system ATP-binding protein
MAGKPLLDVHVTEKRHGEKRVLRNFTLHAKQGELVSLIGASGCGKSTLLAIISGLDRDFAGIVRFDGVEQQGTSSDIGFIFQEPRLFPWLTVGQNVGFAHGASGVVHADVAACLAEVGLAGYDGALPKQLSGGQAQRVAIARGLFTRPRLLLLDEPFSAVDAFTRAHLQELLLRVAREHGLTVLIVTHDLDEALFLSDRVVLMDNEPGPAVREYALDDTSGNRRERGTQWKSTILADLHAAQAL